MLCWNKALWLVKLVTWLTTTNQSAFSAQHIYATLKFACDMIWRSNIISTKITFNYGSLKFAKQFYFPCWSFSAQHIYATLKFACDMIWRSNIISTKITFNYGTLNFAKQFYIPYWSFLILWFDPLVWSFWSLWSFDPFNPFDQRILWSFGLDPLVWSIWSLWSLLILMILIDPFGSMLNNLCPLPSQNVTAWSSPDST